VWLIKIRVLWYITLCSNSSKELAASIFRILAENGGSYFRNVGNLLPVDIVSCLRKLKFAVHSVLTPCALYFMLAVVQSVSGHVHI
jgi:hypothetical protein